MDSNHTAWTVAEAKARLSEVIDLALGDGPQSITRNGRPAVVVVSAAEWEKRTRRKGTLATFLATSPLRGSGLDLKRLRGRPRRVKL